MIPGYFSSLRRHIVPSKKIIKRITIWNKILKNRPILYSEYQKAFEAVAKIPVPRQGNTILVFFYKKSAL